MSSIPSQLARVPNVLASQVILSSLNRTSQNLLNMQIQMSTGLRVNRASDDPVAASAISVLDDVIERRDQWLRNLSHGESILGNVDAALGDASELVLEAKGIAASQIGIGSDEETRRNQAVVIDALIAELVNISNRQFQEIYFFGGEATAEPPIVDLLGGLQYTGVGEGMINDLGGAGNIPITISGEEAFGTLSARVEGDRDLNPGMVADTRLLDLGGARSFGISLGIVNVDVGGVNLAVDLSNAHTVQDVIDTLQTDIQTIDPGATVAISAAGDSFAITPSAGVSITISDQAGEATAADLGLTQTFPAGLTTAGGDVDPILTELSPLSGLSGVTAPLGAIRLENAGQTRDLDLSGATTVQDIMTLVDGLQLGIRVEIAESGDRLNFVNELSGAAMSIGEIAGGLTATELGVRSLTTSTLLADFNDGRGVQIRSGSVDPVTGLPDPAADLDFRVTLKDGRSFDIDLAGAETVQDVLDAINTAAATAGITVPTEFTAGLTFNGNGFMFTDGTLGLDTTVTALNGSRAALDLGILGSTTGATLVGEDRAKVAVDSIFTHLISLRDALLTNDEIGITLAGERLEDDIGRLAQVRAKVGVRSRRVTGAIGREEDLRLQDLSLRSEVRDLDFTEAAIRFSTLQQQLQAGLITASQATSLSLLDFLR